MSALDDALLLVGTDSLPQDIDARLRKLKPDVNEFDWEWVMEGLSMARTTQGDFDSEDEIVGGPDDNST